MISSDPAHVICIGRGVARIVVDDLKRSLGDDFTIIPQPNAFLSTAEHLANCQRYGQICRRYVMA